ncbi:hypothetical protein [Robiginitalea sp. SC105]|uniref:hypothetical protein n=1 Tax=Robiginitalea sp. SC105 TaxID=2762332 RepID=UPI001639BA24|nr:hypothetical protein [Robiginitalea sp. SC105]MBC2840554.1 hypothetical protein [Robiginitalea sp. SC105]
MDHLIPDFLVVPFQKALSHYPELHQLEIRLKIMHRPGTSTMSARPTLATLLLGPQSRTYLIRVSPAVRLGNKLEELPALPEDVLIGWFGHELGHIKDYTHCSGIDMAGFGLKYLLSPSFRRAAEFRADYFAVENGLQEYILRTKHYILHEADIPPAYKARIRKYYCSPEEIEALVQELAGEA